MFDIGAAELLLIAMVALIIIGPKDLPVAMRTAGRWLDQLRALTGHFRVGIDAMIREAEIEAQEKAWARKNEQVMRDHPPDKQDNGDPVMRPTETPSAPGLEQAAPGEEDAEPHRGKSE